MFAFFDEEQNPFEPPRRRPSELTEGQLAKQRAMHKAWIRDSRYRGPNVEEEEAIKKLRDQGAIFAVSHSGGKDSQATLIAVRKVVPDSQILVVHAPLRHVEWEGSAQEAKKDTPKGRPFLLAEKYDDHGDEVWLLERVVSKGKWPDQGRRWCTSDWKNGPISRELGRWADENGYPLIVEAWGLRAEESDKRALQAPLREGPRHGDRSIIQKVPRQWYLWSPIKWWTTDEVFDAIEKAGKKPLWTYQEGMKRASCAFCVLASKGDLRIAARLAPDLYALYVAVEIYIGQTIQRRAGNRPYPIEEFTGLVADPKLVAKFLKAMKETGDLRNVRLPSQVKRLSARRLGQLRVMREGAARRSQLELPIPVGVWA